MNAEPPRVSVITPVFGRARLFAVALDSLRAQTFPAWEALVVDDGSPEEDWRAIAAACDAEPRARLLPGEGARGASARRNQGLRAARGEFVLFLDSDDLLAPNALERRVEELDAAPDTDFVLSPCIVFREAPDDVNRLRSIATREGDLARFLHQDVPWLTTCPTWRRPILDRIGPWDESLSGWQDWEFHIRALLARPRYHRIAGGTYYWRLPSGHSIGDQKLSEDDFRVRGELLFRLAELARASGCFGEPERRALAATIGRMAREWRRRGHLEGPFEFLAKARASGLLTSAEHRALAGHARLYLTPVLGKAWTLGARMLLGGDLLPRDTAPITNAPANQIERWLGP
ncbi:glycosyltransferase family 2 protein [Candidatus Poribacteria bacterium]|nr:glycosyltransferase family 2 protein [Candidatus Poribacteria bacterium]